MTRSFLNRNFESNEIVRKVSFWHDDCSPPVSHYPLVSDLEPDWHLQSWMKLRGKRQADLVKELGWAKGRANKFFHSQHPYRRDVVNELSKWLGIEPWELLMEPQRAMQIRKLADAVLEFTGKKTG